ncbi:MAG: excinuclease ABC subunit UvrC [Pirellulales bacterium]|nr:excinuclease ABC subunit UvrC [Pirellulales bacterium]
MMDESLPRDNSAAAEKARGFPQTPGVYLMKDAAGRVIYVGKAKNLRARAGSYFLKAAAEDPRTEKLVQEIRDIDYLDAKSEIDALLIEARLIKDILPKFNRELRDAKSFPYLEIFVREEFPRVRFTREPKERGTRLFGPFTHAWQLRGAIQVLQKIFKFRTCNLDINPDDPRWRWFRPCLLHSIRQCTAPCNLRIGKEQYRKDIQRLIQVLEGKKEKLLRELRREMAEAAGALRFEEAARLRDEIGLLESLDEHGDLKTHVQPEVFFIDPKKGLRGLQKVLHLARRPRIIEGVDVAHTAGTDTVASIVQFIDGLPFKPGYKRMRIREAPGGDDFAAIHEAVLRRFRRRGEEDEPMPDILLIDGGKGQLGAALAALSSLDHEPPVVLALAKREEIVYRATDLNPEGDSPIFPAKKSGQSPKALGLSRRSYALRLLQAVRDEAHRFAQHYHHILRRKSTLGEG